MNASFRCYRNTSGNHQHQLTVIWGGEKKAPKNKGKNSGKKNPTTTGHQSIMNSCPLLQPEKHING